MSVNEEIKAAMTKGNIIIGARKVGKALKTADSIKTLVVATNCPEELKKDLNHYAKIGGVEIKEFGETGKLLGIFCGKPFGIAALAILNK